MTINGCTRAGTKYTIGNNSEGMCDAAGNLTDAFYKVVDAYERSLPKLTVGQDIYCCVNRLKYMVSRVDAIHFECVQAYSTDMQKALRIPISLFNHTFAYKPIPEAEKLITTFASYMLHGVGAYKHRLGVCAVLFFILLFVYKTTVQCICLNRKLL